MVFEPLGRSTPESTSRRLFEGDIRGEVREAGGIEFKEGKARAPKKARLGLQK